MQGYTGAFARLLLISSILTLGAASGFVVPAFGARLTNFDCNRALTAVTDSPKDILRSKVLSIDQTQPGGAEYLLSLSSEDSTRLYQGLFRPYSKAMELSSPKNAIAAYLVDEFFGRPARVQLAIEYVLNDEPGVFQLNPPLLKPLKKGRAKGVNKQELYSIALFDFLIGNFGRSKESLRPTEDGLSATGHWHAFALEDVESLLNFSESYVSHLKNAWKKADPKLKEQISIFEEDALREELEDVLSQEQITQVWERALYLRRLEVRSHFNRLRQTK